MNLKKMFGFLGLCGLLVLAAPAQRAEAVSLLNPGLAGAVQDENRLTTEVRWHHHRGWHRHHGWHRHWGWRRHHGWHRHWGWRHRHWGWRHRHWGWRHHRWHHRHWRW